MPFDGSGNFSRVHDWTDDRDAGIKIQAARFDQENDDFASAFNLVMLRTGVAAMTGDLDMGQQSITDIGNGTAAAPSIQFNTDPNTGIYLAATGRLGFAANGAERLHVDTSGAAVTGTFEVSGNTTLSGTLTTTGEPTFGGNVFGPTFLASGGSVSFPAFRFSGDGDTGIYSAGTNVLGFATGGAQRALLNSSGLTLTGGLDVSAGITFGTTFRMLDNGTGGIIQAGTSSADATGVVTIARRGTTGTAISKFDVYATDSVFSGNVTANNRFLVGTGAGAAGDSTQNTVKPAAASAFMVLAGGAGRGKVTVSNDAVILSSGTSSYVAINTGASSTNTGTERMRVQDDGKVGIATSSPIWPLSIANPDGTSGLIGFVPNAVTGSYLRFGGSGAGSNIFKILGAGDTEYFRLDTGNITVPGDVTAVDFNATSDKAFKENVEPITGFDFSKLRPVTFNWKETGDRASGFIAQELAEHLPHMVKGEDGNMRVSYQQLIPYLVAEVQNLRKIVGA